MSARAMLLTELLPDVAAIPAGLTITGLSQDSRAVRPGHAFVAIAGFGAHGLKFAADAQAAGAAIVLYEPPVPPGIALPRHAHRGAELTLVLEGAFVDETGRHGPGDLVEVDGEESHRPVAEGTADCVCLIATEGRLRFGGLLGALFGAVARV